MNPIKTISPTSRQQFNRCEYEWYQQRVLGLTTPPTASMALGSEVHDVLETVAKVRRDNDPRAHAYKADGKAYNIAQPGFAHIPNDIGNYEIEVWLSHPCGPLTFKGKGDLCKPGHIQDWKTSADPMRWGKSPAELAADSQMLAYAYTATMQEGWKPQPYQLTHVYLATTGMPMAHRSDAHRVPWSRVESTWQEYVADAHRMVAVAKLPEDEVPFKLTGCNAYSGCPYRGRCPHVSKAKSTSMGFGNPNNARRENMSPSRDALRAALGLSSNPTNINPPDASGTDPNIDKAVTSLAKFMDGRESVPARSIKVLCTKLGVTDMDAVIKKVGLVDYGDGKYGKPQAALNVPLDDDIIPVPDDPSPTMAGAVPLTPEEQTIYDYMVDNNKPTTEKEVKAANKKVGAYTRLHKQRVHNILAALSTVQAGVADDPAPTPDDVAKDVKGQNIQVALSKLGYSPEQITRMDANATENILTERIDARDVSILPDGRLHVIPKTTPDPEDDVTVGETETVVPPELEPQVQQAVDRLAAEAPTESPTIILVDCLCDIAVDINVLLRQEIEDIECAAKVDFIGLLEYAEGYRTLAAKLAKRLRSEELTGIIAISSDDPAAKYLMPILKLQPNVTFVRSTR